MNTLGTYLRLTTFGESHGAAMGGILDGLPPGLNLDMELIHYMLDRRRTGKSRLVSARRESDEPEILSGISRDGVTLGTPIGFIFRNTDARPQDYSSLETHYRPNHADYTYIRRYGIREASGGGRASARESVNWVMGGALAMMYLRSVGIQIRARVTAVGHIGYRDPLAAMRETPLNPGLPYEDEIEKRMLEEVEAARRDLDSIGGRVSCIVTGAPSGLGTPVFGKIQARLAEAMLSVNAVKGFEYGLGAATAVARGSETMDLYNESFTPGATATDRSGGMLGGITTGMPIGFNVWFKPTPTIPRPMPMADAEGNITVVTATGRHDPCVALRAPVIIEAMTALVMADALIEIQGARG